MSDPKAESDAARRARNGRNIAIALGLLAFVAIVFIVTITHLAGNVAAPHRF
jgi:hypothetical protein